MSPSRRPSLRQIPSVEKILSSPEFGPLIERFGRERVKLQLRSELDSARRSARFAGFALGPAAESVGAALQASLAPPLQPVINGTGIIIHTNLGRSPIDDSVWSAGGSVAVQYSNLEFDLERGARGSRDQHLGAMATQLFGCEAALLVNNNAGAVLLVLSAIASGKDVIVSRGELVEIGGSFRVPDVIEQGGARLLEVGTTNRTRRRDYEKAATRRTGAILKVHRSNFDLVGFTETAPLEDLVEVGKVKKIPVVMDEGTGRVVDLEKYGFASQKTIAEILAAGVDVVTFSTDKLMGSLQGGMIAGRKDLIAKCARHPLMRALRVGKESYGTLAATMRSFLTGKYEREIPVYRMLSASLAELRSRAEALARRVDAEVVETRSALGGGTTPTEMIASIALSLPGSPSRIDEALRRGNPPIVGRIEKNRYLLDLRTIFPSQDDSLARGLSNLR